MARSITISVNAAQAAVDAINQRLSIYEEALKVVNGEVEWDDDDSLESEDGALIADLLGQKPADLERHILDLKAARTELCKV